MSFSPFVAWSAVDGPTVEPGAQDPESVDSTMLAYGMHDKGASAARSTATSCVLLGNRPILALYMQPGAAVNVVFVSRPAPNSQGSSCIVQVPDTTTVQLVLTRQKALQFGIPATCRPEPRARRISDPWSLLCLISGFPGRTPRKQLAHG